MVPGQRIQLKEKVEENLAREFADKVQTALNERFELQEKWKKWFEAYEGVVGAEKTFPWPGASNLWAPVTAINVDAIAARVIGTIYGQKPVWTIKTFHTDYGEERVALETFLEWAIKNDIKLYEPFRDWIFNTVLLGTGIVKLLWWRERQKIFIHPSPEGRAPLSEKTPIGKEEVICNAPKVFPLDLEDFVISDSGSTIDDAEWVAHRFRLREGLLDKRVKDEIYDKDKVDKIKGHTAAEPTEVREVKERAEGIQREGHLEEYELYEVWAYADVDEDGKEENCVFTLHLPTSTILRPNYNSRYDGKRPFIPARLVKRPNRFYGVGVAEMITTLQVGINTILNQRIDNATIANTRCFKGRKGSSINANTNIYPGSITMMDDLANDLQEFKLGDIYTSAFNNESVLRDYIERRTGISDYSLGRESQVKGRSATATGTLAIIQEGNKRLDLFIRDMRSAMSELGAQIVELYQQYCPTGRPYYVLGDKGEYVEQILQFPREFIRNRFSFNVTASTATINREVEKQTNMALFNIMLGYYDRLLLAAKTILDPRMQSQTQMRQVVSKLSKASMVLAERILDSFEVRDTEALLPKLEELGIEVEQRRETGFGGVSPLTGGAESPELPFGAEEEPERTTS